MFDTIIFPAFLIGGIGFVFGYILAYVAKIFYVEVNPKIEQIKEILPGANCGACGFPGCSGYAESIVEKDCAIDLCPPGGVDIMNKIAELMGKTTTNLVEKIAVINCNSGGYSNTNIKYEYFGIKSCKAATLISEGPNQCRFGCVSQNDCIAACKFGAISLDYDGMRSIDKNKCNGCSACTNVCPRNLIYLVPKRNSVYILCSSKEKGVTTKKNCGSKYSCIGCGLCSKKCPFDAISLENNLAKIDYNKCENCGLCVIHCPTKVIFDTKKRGKAVIDAHLCIGCTICTKKCITKCISGELKKAHEVDRDNCIGCELCVEKCPKNAIGIDHYTNPSLKSG